MRRKFVLGMGLAGLLTGSAAVGQFVPNRTPTTPIPLGGAQPVRATLPAPTGFATGGAPVGSPAPVLPPATPAVPTPTTPAAPPMVGTIPPVGGFNPATTGHTPPASGFQPATGAQPGMAGDAPVPATPLDADLSALGANHPWALRPEHGAFFICVKSYSRPHRPDPNDPGLSARELAEGLGTEIRDAHRLNVYLYEYVSEEKKAEIAAATAARQRAQAFLAAADRYRQQSQLNGMEFLQPDNKIRYKTFNYRDQIAVLIGGFATEDDAIAYLAKVKKWPAPRNTQLLDGGAIATKNPDTKKTVIEKTFLNPFPQAMVVPNPAIPKTATPAKTGLDPFIVKLNKGRPYSLLKATKTWTLGVKSFTAPITIMTPDSPRGGLMKKFGIGSGSSGADVLAAGGEQAETMAKMLREMKGPVMMEAFVLHTSSGSIVTVGQFDGPNDPALLEMRRVLMNLTFNVAEDDRGRKMVGFGQKLFGDNIVPMPIPKQ